MEQVEHMPALPAWHLWTVAAWHLTITADNISGLRPDTNSIAQVMLLKISKTVPRYTLLFDIFMVQDRGFLNTTTERLQAN